MRSEARGTESEGTVSLSDHQHATLSFSHRERFRNADRVIALTRGDLVGHSVRYDAYYCEGCGEWAEPKCSDPDCVFCAKRPPRLFDGPALLRRRIKLSRIGLAVSAAMIALLFGGFSYYVYTLEPSGSSHLITSMVMIAAVLLAVAAVFFSSAFANAPRADAAK